MLSDKQIFIDWLNGRKIPESELDHELAKASKLKFKNHADNADFKDFLPEDKLESSFKAVIKASY